MEVTTLVGVNPQVFSNAFHSGVIILDQQKKIVCWNDWMTRYSQDKTADKAIGQLFDEMFPELVNQRIYQVIANNLATGLPATLSNVLNKAPFPLYEHGQFEERMRQQINITRLKLAENIIYCVINITNVTAARVREYALEKQVRERKVAEQQLLKRTQQLQAALCVSKAGVFQFDITTRQMYLDNKAAKLFDIQAPFLHLYSQWLQSIYPDDLKKVTQFMEYGNTENQGYELDCEFRVQTKGETIKWILAKSAFDTKSVNGVFVDITQQKIDQDLLREKEAAEIANKAKSVFLANMSHELRTPMHGILSFARLGMSRVDTLPKEKLFGYFSRVNECGERLLYLLNDLLDLSKLEAGKMEMKFSANDMLVIIEQAVSEQEGRLQELNIRLEYSYQVGETSAVFDKVRITQVITNYLSNAIKYTSKDETILFSIKRIGDQLEVSVKDHGVGILEHEIDSIFEKFRQGSDSEDGSGGTGLGLAICTEIIKEHDGEIGVVNNPEGGACFYFKIPLQPKVPY